MRYLKIFLFALLFPSVCSAAQIASILCENNTTDTLGFFTAITGTPTYVAGFSGQACRSAHNNDDGDAEDYRNLAYSGFPASGELYVKMYLKYEAAYVNTSSNAKWAWFQGTTSGHSEIIYSVDASPYDGNIDVRWQHSGGGAGFKGGTDLVEYSGNIPYTKGDWLKVEFYIKQSTGATKLNADGVMWLKVNDVTYIVDEAVSTGLINGTIQITGINGTADQASGAGWWQLDSLEAWDAAPGGADSTPSTFSFTDVTGAALSTVTTTSPCVTVAGIDAGQTPAISISGAGCTYNVDGGAYTSDAGTVGLDNVVCLRGTSSASYSTAYPSCTLTIGGVSDSNAPWTVTTQAASEVPSAPRFRGGSMRGRWK